MKYSLRKNYFISNDEMEAKVAFKTKETDWEGTEQPVVILMSIHSAFHESIEGDIKVNALLKTIRNSVKGPVTILLADRAHLRSHNNDFQKCLRDAKSLEERFSGCFEGCRVEYWHSYIYQDEGFEQALECVKLLYGTDPVFRQKLIEDDCVMEDILEQCACILLLEKKGYRFQFYPGKPYASTEYLSSRVSWIHVFLSIEKKRIGKSFQLC